MWHGWRMSNKANLLCVSDGAAAFLVPILTWLSSMDIVHVDDEDWSLEEVERNVTTRGDTIALVMHPDDFRDGVLHCGPRVSHALTVGSRLKKNWIFLVPVEVDAAIKAAKVLNVRLSEGIAITGLPDGMATSDVRTVLAMLLLDGEATATRAATPQTTDTTPSK